MYHTFYHLHAEPFRLTPDPAFCYRHARYARALAHMQYALWQGEGFIMVTGMPGTGKTTLVEQFHSELNSTRTLIAKLTSTQLQADELLQLICLSLGVVVEAHDKASALHQLRQFTIQHTKQGRRILLLIDEAQDLPEHALEELRLLGNLQLNGRPLLQIFLVGQQHLLDLVERPAMQPLYQRLVAACHLETLNPDETRAYIEYRLRRAGWKGEPVFDERSYRMIHRFSEGFPRQINKVCSRLMLYGSTEEKHKIDGSDCLKVLRELLDELPNSTHESSFQACVDLLNESRSVPAESGNEVAAPVEAAPPLDVQQSPSLADKQVRPQATPELEPVQTHPDAGHVAAEKTQTVSVPGIIERWDEIATRERSRLAAFMQSEEHTMDATADRQSTVPLTVERAAPAVRRRQSMLWPALLHNQTARRASVPLGLLVSLLTVLLLVSHGDDGVGSDELAAPSQASEPQNTVARSAPEPLVAPSDAAPEQEPASPAGNIKAAVPASPQRHAEASSLQNASQAAEPVVELPMLSGNNIAFAAFDDNLTGPNQQRGRQETLPETSNELSVAPAAVPQQAPAEIATATANPVQSTQPAVTASAPLSGSAVAATQPEAASVVGLHGSSTTVEQASAPASLAGLEVATVTPPSEAQAATDPQAVQASAKQLRINELMASAEQALREYRLTVPQGNSAWDYYRQVLQIEPQHHGASAGIQRIVNSYTRRAERALAASQIDKARTNVTRGLMVSPSNRKLLALKRDVAARESWLETQASLAAAAAAEAKAAALRMPATPPPEQEKPAPRFLDKLKAIFSNRVPHEIP